MSNDLYTLIGYQVEVTADWRRRRAEYFPDDARNARAAKELERLAAEVDQLEGSSVHEQVRLATDRLKNEDWFAMSESVYAELRSVGFDGTYESGLRFLEWYLRSVAGEIRRASVGRGLSSRHGHRGPQQGAEDLADTGHSSSTCVRYRMVSRIRGRG
jgi:hypothetical protein